MTAKTKLWFVLVLLQLLLLAFPAAAKDPHIEDRPSCRVCGMWIDQYKKTAAELVYKDGRKESTCGVACMLREVDEAGGLDAFESVKVHDWVSGELVDAETATYVFGSHVIPDMVPNYIAFAKREEAEAFFAKEGGEIIDFNFAYQDISPVGTTAPFRIRTAVTPGAGNFSVGMVYGYAQKDNLKIGSNGQTPDGFIGTNKAQPQAPSQFEGHSQALIVNYSPADDISLFINVPWFERRTHTLSRPITSNLSGNSGIIDSVGNENGLGDISLEGRYNFWRTTRWDKFATLLLGTSLPTGQFSGARSPIINPIAKRKLINTGPALQLGKDTATFTGGLLYSQRWKDFWLHTSALYTVSPENDQNFAFGDVATVGLALHYTPNYDLMFGVEMDANYAEKNEDLGYKISNSGGTSVNLAFVSDWRFLNAFGGNFKLRSSIGLPIYEDLNYRDLINMNKLPYQQVQLGDGFFANVALQWTFRSSPDYQH